MAHTGFRISFRIAILGVIVSIILVMSIIMGIIVMNTGEASARRDAQLLFDQTSRQVSLQIDARLGMISSIADMGSASAGILQKPRDQGLKHPVMPWFRRILDTQPVIYALYTGWSDGSFLMLINANNDPAILKTHKAPDGTRYIARSIVTRGTKRVQLWACLSPSWTILDQHEEPLPTYDPRQRDWYKSALLADNRTVLGDVYVFNSLRQPGITASRKLYGGGGSEGVFGVDMTLSGLASLLNDASPSRRGGAILLDGQKRFLAASREAESWLVATLGALPEVLDPLDASGILARDSTVTINQVPYLRHIVSSEPRPGTRYHTVILAPLEEFEAFMSRMRPSLIMLALVTLLVAIPVALIISRSISRMIISLARDAERVSLLDFSGSGAHTSVIKEFDRLGNSFRSMKDDLASRTDFLNVTLAKLERVVELGIAMSAEKDANRLVELILQGAKELTHADGGSLYLVKDGRELEFQIILNDSLGFALGGTSGRAPTMPPVQLYDSDGKENHHNVVTHAFHTGKTVNILDAYHAGIFDFSGTRAFDEKNKYRSTSFLTVPLRPLGGTVMGALQLINATDPETNSIVAFTPELQRLVEALAAEAATAIYNRQLLENQEHLFDALVQFIAGAIDTKSHYTGAHCARVPVLARMIAEATTGQTEGPLAGFSFKNSDEWREFQIAAWLHDCGKVTTPEFVVDKATKLETIYNRIHEVRTRFEVLLRDARITALQAQLEGADPAVTNAALMAAEDQLQKDFAFLASCNSGDEFMSPERVERLKNLARLTWTRHFDNRLGLSWEETNRFEGALPDPLPVQEYLLADRPEHRIPRNQAIMDRYKGLNFTVPSPELLYNYGELYNLCTGRGTLTAEERYKINEHVMQTIVMLERLPLPDNLKRVPLYAGTHHETLKGTGYPRRLSAADLDIPARIMAIADIFEALSSSDRPYKKTKKLSECVKTLHLFKKDGHIDPDLFDLFLTSGTYRTYATQYLRPEQIDDVDIAPYLG